jgi:hypothetical protein
MRHHRGPKEIHMRRFNKFWSALLWLGVLAVALFPFPWVL